MFIWEIWIWCLFITYNTETENEFYDSEIHYRGGQYL